METIQYLVLAGRQRNETALSALPGAPVIPFVAGPQRARRVRNALSGALHHLGDAVAPTPGVPATPLCAD